MRCLCTLTTAKLYALDFCASYAESMRRILGGKFMHSPPYHVKFAYSKQQFQLVYCCAKRSLASFSNQIDVGDSLKDLKSVKLFSSSIVREKISSMHGFFWTRKKLLVSYFSTR